MNEFRKKIRKAIKNRPDFTGWQMYELLKQMIPKYLNGVEYKSHINIITDELKL